MWARYAEIALALWLAASPFLFAYPPDRVGWRIHDFVCAGLIAGAALLSHRQALRRAHLVSFAVGLWLIGFGWIQVRHTPGNPPTGQNWISVGLVLVIFAIVPSQATQPPAGWRSTQSRGAH